MSYPTTDVLPRGVVSKNETGERITVVNASLNICKPAVKLAILRTRSEHLQEQLEIETNLIVKLSINEKMPLATPSAAYVPM